MGYSTQRLRGWWACLLLVSASGQTVVWAQQPTSPTEENRRIVEDAFARWAAGGTGFFNEVLADDVVWTIEGSGPSAGEFRGREAFVERAVRPFAARLASPVRPKAVKIWADGDHVIANWEGQGMARDGQPYRNSYAWILHMQAGKAVEVTAFLDLAPYDDVLHRIPSTAPREQTPSAAPASTISPSQSTEQKMTQNSYVGMWVTDDGHVRHELLPTGRYVETRGSRERAYEGRYEVNGTHIEYWDDTGFTADGDFVDENTLHHGGMVLRRK